MDSVDPIPVAAKRQRQVGLAGNRTDRGGEESEATGNAVDVRVNRQRGPSEGEEQRACRRLRRETRSEREAAKGCWQGKSREMGKIEFAPFAADGIEGALVPLHLEIGQPAGPDRHRHIVARCRPNVFPRRVTGLERTEGMPELAVGGVLREDREDRFIERREARLPPGHAVACRKEVGTEVDSLRSVVQYFRVSRWPVTAEGPFSLAAAEENNSAPGTRMTRGR